MENQIKDLLKANYAFWDQLNEQEQESFCSYSYIQAFQKNEFVHDRQEDCLGILLVLKGRIRVYIQSDEGREITLFRIGKGEVCTLSASCIMQEISFEIMIESTEETEILITGVPYMKKLMDQNMYVENFIYRQTTERFSDVMWAMTEILFKSFDKRLAGYLEEERQKTGSLVILTTHDVIARNMGSAREVVSRMLKYFEKEGILTLSRGAITIIDPGHLKKML